MPVFEKGHGKVGGRRKGSRNKITESIKSALNALLPEDELAGLWQDMFGKPATIVAGADELPPIKIDISAIPKKRELA